MWERTIEHKGDIITVKNKLSKAILYLNEKEIDSQGGLVDRVLTGETTSGESIRVTLNSGFIKVHCSIYINDERVFKD